VTTVFLLKQAFGSLWNNGFADKIVTNLGLLLGLPAKFLQIQNIIGLPTNQRKPPSFNGLFSFEHERIHQHC
jgi:hypothetical protein